MQYKKYVNATEVLSLAVSQFSLLSLATQSIKSCNAKRRRQRKQPKTISRSSQQNNNFVHAAHFFCTFLRRCFARLQRQTPRNFLVTRFIRSCSLFLWLPLIFTLVAARLSFFSPLIKFSWFSSNEIGLLCFLSLALALSLLSMSMQTLRLSGKKESDLLLLFLSLNFWESMRFNAKTRVCVKCKISSRLT